MADFEKLGVFYLGREYDLAGKKLGNDLLLYDSRDLVTHAVCVGMTGSGKTGLCIGVIEEAAIDGVPAIIIDPKGDLSNLLLTFPSLRPEDFTPWVNEEDARKKGLSTEEYGAQQAELWRKGLADWGEDGARIQRLRNAAEFTIYTPGSSAGVPISILKSFAAPPAEIAEDGELLQERIQTTVTSLLGLAGVNAEPLQSREHILLSMIVGQAWGAGRDLTLEMLIQQVQTPPVTRIGVLDLESFYPSKDRFALVLALNNLLAAPGFRAWLEGTPLDIASILHTPQGKPRVAIFSIAHLGDPERMFFVSLLLNQVIGWMRGQPGTTSLRALLYMDEIFGYFPPVANPPSKQPFLTLLKQARAFGLGVVLATQNPVDLDYKGLSNAGTWFIGRLQTERDKERMMAGLEGVAASAGGKFNRGRMEQLLAGLSSRVFLLNNVHDDEPIIFQTRWTMSYLRGPMTRQQIKALMDPYKAAAGAPAPAVRPGGAATVAAEAPAARPASVAAGAGMGAPGGPPPLGADIPQFYAPARGSAAGMTYQPLLLGSARIHFVDAKTKTDITQDVVLTTPMRDQAVPINWDESQPAETAIADLERAPAAGVAFGTLPAEGQKAKSYATWNREFVSWLYGSQKVELLRSPGLGAISKPGETERDFRVRLGVVAREQRDQVTETLRAKYAPKLAALKEKQRRAEQSVEREAGQAKQAKVQTAISLGATVLSAFIGSKPVSLGTMGRAATTARGVGRAAQQQADVQRAQETADVLQGQVNDLNAAFEAEVAALQSKIDPQTEALETISIRPKKTDITVQLVALVWASAR